MTISTEQLSPIKLLTSLVNQAALLTTPSRQLFVLLHCLLPATFLPALDLLDRNLVVKPQLQLSKSSIVPDVTTNTIKSDPEVEADHIQDGSTGPTQVYYVRSSPPITNHYNNLHISSPSAATLSSYRDKSSSNNYRHYNYEVRPYAWNCTCVAFTFSMVASLSSPASTVSSSTLAATATSFDSGGQPSKKTIADFFRAASIKQEDIEDRQEDVKKEINDIDKEGVSSGKWSWGGPNTQNERNPPVCKHLVACVLAERCPDLVGKLIMERKVTLEESVELSVLWE